MEVDDVLTLEHEALGPLRSPVMLVALRGWFDVAGAATTALELISTADHLVTVGGLDPDPFYDFTQERPTVEIDEGELRVIVWPVNRFDVVRPDGARDLVVLVGTEPHLHWRTYADAVITVAERLRCEAVVTVGAAAEAVPHTRTPPVTGSTTNRELARRLGLSAPSYQGITGLAGTLQTALDQRGMPAVSLRVGIPHYLMNAEHPLAVAALQAHLAHVLGITMRDHRLSRDAERWRSLHDEVVEQDPQLALYVRMLEVEHDRRAEASIPSADDLGAQFEAFLRDQRDEPE
ncbi:MAG: PAC2 family protein [Ilumatobacteraceae bacterium]|jgi:proteasome assembly chaperone (PAC2) family protein|nr:PAC2 family protein [Ilumatobacteraceae bacterium]